MRTITSTYITAVVSYDARVWLQERLTIETKPFASWSAADHFYRVECAGITADYESNDGALFIDVSDLLKYAYKTQTRERAGGYMVITLRVMIGTAWHEVRGQLDQITIDVDGVAGLLDPALHHLPPMEHAPLLIDYFHTLPPSVLLAPIIGGLWAEAITSGEIRPTLNIVHTGGRTTQEALDGYKITLPNDTQTFYFTMQGDPDAALRRWVLKRQPSGDCEKLACVEWVGASGVIKRHTWHIGRFTAKTTDAQALQPDARTFRTRKVREDSCTIWLDGLSPYDFAYYADIMQSNDVRVWVSDTNALGVVGADGRLLPCFAVDVVPTAWTPNDGEADFQKLEVTIKTGKYYAADL